MSDAHAYGEGDATYQAAGGEAGIRALVEDFYDVMATNPSYATIVGWHPDDLSVSVDKLARFLCGWMGGPKRYREKYGPISIPGVHRHLGVGNDEMQQWLDCMDEALARQPYPPELVSYLLEQLAVPARRIVAAGRS